MVFNFSTLYKVIKKKIKAGSGFGSAKNECGSTALQSIHPYTVPVQYVIYLKYRLTSVVVPDPDPHGSGTFTWIRIRN